VTQNPVPIAGPVNQLVTSDNTTTHVAGFEAVIPARKVAVAVP
jgi:hypothetical protein